MDIIIMKKNILKIIPPIIKATTSTHDTIQFHPQMFGTYSTLPSENRMTFIITVIH